MVREEYANAYVEVLEVLKQLNKEDFNKIPKEYIEYLEKNANKYFSFKYDLSKTLEEQDLSEDAKIILFFFFEKFGANEKQKKKINDFRANMIAKNEEEKLQKYNYEDLFAKKRKHYEMESKTEGSNNGLIVQNKTNIFIKIINYIKRFFNRNK